MGAETASGVVRLRGNWVDVRFEHDLRISGVLQVLGGRRLALGHWRVPASELPELARRLSAFDLTWVDRAADAYAAEIEREERRKREDQLAVKIKRGEASLGSWSSPVPLLAHQRSGVEFLCARSGALLCDEQGLGKTVTVLVAFWVLAQNGQAEQLLVVCPNSVKQAWHDQIQKFFPDWRVSVAAGQRRSRSRSYEVSADVYVTNYEAVRSDYADLRLLLRRQETVLVCDESHLAKNMGSRTSKALDFIRSAAKRVWALSGTPVPNSLADAYAQVHLADGGRLLGSQAQFTARYLRSDSPHPASTLKRTLDPILLRRTKEEALDLPEKLFEERYVQLRGEQRELYEALRKDLADEVRRLTNDEFVAAQSHYLTRLLRLSQIAANPRLVSPSYVGDPAKVTELDRILTDLIEAGDRKVVLWSYYVRNIEEFLERYAEYRPVAIYGAIPIPERKLALDAFQEDASSMLFIGNPQAAGTGLTLTAAHYAVYETLTWRYDLYAQSIDRTHRIGQDRNVTYFTLLADGTVDLDILENLRKKEGVAAEVLGDRDVPQLTQEQMLDMLARKPS